MQSIGSVGLGRNGWLRAPAAASYVGLSVSTLAKMRVRGDGPPWTTAGARIVVYPVSGLDEWLAHRVRRSTSEEAA
jgi:predicted DNA-binding transcriptional regulator AlpA